MRLGIQSGSAWPLETTLTIRARSSCLDGSTSLPISNGSPLFIALTTRSGTTHCKNWKTITSYRTRKILSFFVGSRVCSTLSGISTIWAITGLFWRMERMTRRRRSWPSLGKGNSISWTTTTLSVWLQDKNSKFCFSGVPFKKEILLIKDRQESKVMLMQTNSRNSPSWCHQFQASN